MCFGFWVLFFLFVFVGFFVLFLPLGVTYSAETFLCQSDGSSSFSSQRGVTALTHVLPMLSAREHSGSVHMYAEPREALAPSRPLSLPRVGKSKLEKPKGSSHKGPPLFCPCQPLSPFYFPFARRACDVVLRTSPRMDLAPIPWNVQNSSKHRVT